MSDKDTDISQALNTKLEEEFIAPLTAVRGILEILRDFPKLPPADQQKYINNALAECSRLEMGIDHLATTVYTAGHRSDLKSTRPGAHSELKKYTSRIHLIEELSIIELDFSEFEFSSSKLVNEFYNELEAVIKRSGQSWYFIVNYSNCSIWPEAWVAFAHRGKKINVGYSLGTVRYTQQNSAQENDAVQSRKNINEVDMFSSRELAVSYINSLRSTKN